MSDGQETKFVQLLPTFSHQAILRGNEKTEEIRIPHLSNSCYTCSHNESRGPAIIVKLPVAVDCSGLEDEHITRSRWPEYARRLGGFLEP